MSPLVLLVLVLGACFAASGQVLLKIGAEGREGFAAFVNAWIGCGLVLYILGAALWIYALSRAPLILVYPFTVLTFVLVYGLAILFLGEQPSLYGLVGVVLILAGLYLIMAHPASP